MSHDDINKKGKWLQKVVESSSLGFEFAAFILIGAFIGNYLDERWNTSPWIMLTGFILGVFMSFYRLYEYAKKEEGNKD